MQQLKLYICIIFLIFKHYNLAFAIKPTDNFNIEKKIKDIDHIISCDQCCFPIRHKTCDIFYGICKTNLYQNAVFFIASKNLNDSQFIGRLKDYIESLENMVLIVINKKVYLDREEYKNLITELATNIKTLQEKNNPLSYDSPYYHWGEYLVKRYNDHEQVNRKKLNIHWNKYSYQNVYKVFRLYSSILNIDENGDGLITIYNKDHKNLCEKNFNNTSNVIIEPTNFITPSTFNKTTISPIIINNNNSLFNDTNENNYQLQNSYEKINKLTVIVVASSVPILVISAIIFGTFMYIKYKKNNSNTDNIKNIAE